MATGKKSHKSKKKKMTKNPNSNTSQGRSAKEIDVIQRNAAVLSSLNALKSSLPGILGVDVSASRVSSDLSVDPVYVSHYTANDQPQNCSDALVLMKQGADIINGTATKFSLVSKASIKDSAGLSEDLRRGAEHICTGFMIICSDSKATDVIDKSLSSGCDLPLRRYLFKAVSQILGSVVELVRVYACDDYDVGGITEKDNNVSAKLTGVVWSACDSLTKQCPMNNRAAYRRGLFRYAGDCNETLEEFTEMIDCGIREEKEPSKADNETDGGTSGEDSNSGDGGGDESLWDAFCNGDEEFLYSSKEIPIARAAIGLIKCSRGAINVALTSMDAAGMATGGSSGLLITPSALYVMAADIGCKITDLGSLLYPPLDVSKRQGDDNENCALADALKLQHDALLSFLSVVICDEGRTDLSFTLPEASHDLAKRLRETTKIRFEEGMEGICNLGSSQMLNPI